MLSAKHEEQVKNLIGKKVTVYLSLKKYIKVLREDRNGLYIKFQKERVPVHPDTNGLNVLFFTGLEPKNSRAIKNLKHEGDM